MDEPAIVELYGDQKILDGCLRVVGFTEDRQAHLSKRDSLTDIWGVFQPIGDASDYDSNEVFAGYEGCHFKLDNSPSSVAG